MAAGHYCFTGSTETVSRRWSPGQRNAKPSDAEALRRTRKLNPRVHATIDACSHGTVTPTIVLRTPQPRPHSSSQVPLEPPLPDETQPMSLQRNESHPLLAAAFPSEGAPGLVPPRRSFHVGAAATHHLATPCSRLHHCTAQEHSPAHLTRFSPFSLPSSCIIRGSTLEVSRGSASAIGRAAIAGSDGASRGGFGAVSEVEGGAEVRE